METDLVFIVLREQNQIQHYFFHYNVTVCNFQTKVAEKRLSEAQSTFQKAVMTWLIWVTTLTTAISFLKRELTFEECRS